MADLLATLSGVIETAKKLLQLSSKIRDAESRNLIADLNLALAELKIQLADMQEENRRLREELAAKTQRENYRAQLKLRQGLYYFEEPPAGRAGGPYCPRCFDVAEKLVLVNETPPLMRDLARYICPNCKATYS